MTRLFRLLLAMLVLFSLSFPQSVWARPSKNRHYVQHHRVRHVKHHHAHRTGA